MKISPTESQIFGYKIGRNPDYLESFIADEVEHLLLQSSLDICRIKVNGNQESLFQELHRLHIPFDIFTINYLNQGPIILEPTLQLNTDFSYRVPDNPVKDEDFMMILEDILQSKSWFEYESTLGKHCMPPSKRKSAAINYYSSFSKKENANNSSVVLLKNNEPIGIMVGYKNLQVYNGVIFGILSKFRGLGYAKYAYLMMQEEWSKMGVIKFQNDVSIYNIASQKSNHSQNITAKGVYFNITLYPFLDHEHNKYESLDLSDSSFEGVLTYLQTRFPSFTINELKHKSYKKNTVASTMTTIRVVLDNSAQKFLVVHSLAENEVLESYYISMFK